MASRSYNKDIAKQVLEMAGLGMPLKMMAQILSIPSTSIYRLYENEIAVGKSQASYQIAKVLFSLATNADGETPHAIQFQAAKYWSNTQMGWSETAHIALEHQNAPVQINFVTPELKQLYGTKKGRSAQHGQTSETDEDATIDIAEAENCANERESVQGEQTWQIKPTFIRH